MVNTYQYHCRDFEHVAGQVAGGPVDRRLLWGRLCAPRSQPQLAVNLANAGYEVAVGNNHKLPGLVVAPAGSFGGRFNNLFNSFPGHRVWLVTRFCRWVYMASNSPISGIASSLPRDYLPCHPESFGVAQDKLHEGSGGRGQPLPRSFGRSAPSA
jgi:hypothetical protein